MADELSDDDEAASAIAVGLFGPAARATPVVGRGSVNKVFFVESPGGKVVIRMSDRPDAPDEYAKEVWCIGRAAALGVPVPSVLRVGRRGRHAYMVESFVAGDEGRDAPAAESEVWRALGGYARLIHSIDVPGFGLKLSEITVGGGREAWARHLEYNVESLNEDDALLGLRVVTREESSAVREVFKGLRGRDFRFGLNHGDLSLRNTIVGAEGRVTLLDWGSAEAAAVPHHDLIQLLKTGMTEGDPSGVEFRAFLDGYGISPAELERMMPELEALLTLRAFDKLRWALDWSVDDLGDYVGHARAAARRLLRRT
ncbi:MAG TPA: aminoglycoside phosphotransferase family protein [Pyrinomonadaceae bacterium]|jgi:aminoglycoside phosphotransferase (APT) family kinase protein